MPLRSRPAAVIYAQNNQPTASKQTKTGHPHRQQANLSHQAANTGTPGPRREAPTTKRILLRSQIARPRSRRRKPLLWRALRQTAPTALRRDAAASTSITRPFDLLGALSRIHPTLMPILLTMRTPRVALKLHREILLHDAADVTVIAPIGAGHRRCRNLQNS